MTQTSVVPLISDSYDGLAKNISDIDADAAAALAAATAAAAAAATAQANAITALADAAIAYNAAVNSLQPSAYAIQNPTTKQLTAIDATGLTVYSGASSTSGARVVLNSTGLAGFNSSNVATFSVSATTGAAVFSGSVTGATITGGTLNIAGNAIIDSAGLLTATGATITGTINANAGYFGSPTNGFSIGATGLTGVGTGAITGGVIQTSSSGDAVVMSGTSNSLFFKYGGSVYGHMMANTSGNVMIHYGATATPAGTAYPQIFVGATAVVLSQSVTRSAVLDSGGLDVTGSIDATLDVTANRDLFTPSHTTVTDAANGRVTVTLGRVTRSTASSQRYKENIIPLRDVDELDPKKLLDIPVRAFTYREDYLSESDSRFGTLIPGFIAEEVDAVYPIAADYEDGDVESWNDRMIVPGMLALIQDLYKEVQTLKGGING
jgi:hypothetical protein